MAESRKFLSVVIASGLDFDMLTPEDVLGHVTMDVLAHHLPSDLKADLLSAGLAAETMSATLVLETLGLEGIAEHVPSSILWKCVAESASKSLGEEGSAPKEEEKEKSEAAPKAPAAAKAKPKENARAKTVARKPNRSASVEPEPAPEPLPEPEPAPKPAPFASAPEAAPTKPAPFASPVSSQDPPTRVPEPSDPPMPRERMQTVAEPDNEEYFDADTSVGNEPAIGEVEYVEEISYAEGDEVTAFGQD